jgi:hypothetical protein
MNTVSPWRKSIECNARALAQAPISRSTWLYRNTRGTPVDPEEANIIQPRSAQIASSIVV